MSAQSRAPLFEAVKEYAKSGAVPFHIPGHKLGAGADKALLDFSGRDVFRLDLSEVRGTDDLHAPTGAIAEAQRLAAAAWGADETFFLVNGTSAGIVSAICSVVGPGEGIVVPRNVHKSVIYGLVISGAVPTYVMPRVDPDLGLIGSLRPSSVKAALEKNPGVKAVFTVSPTYHGVMSDIAGIARIAHERGVPVITDEAHGAHLRFSKSLPADAMESGADIAIQSTHKTAGSLTQSSMLHTRGELVDRGMLRAALSMTQSTSPSYVLLTSLDTARRNMFVNGALRLEEIREWLEAARAALSGLPSVRVLPGAIPVGNLIYRYEPLRLVFGIEGLSGYRLFEILENDYNIEAEFADPHYVVCTAGIGTQREHVEALESAVARISETLGAAEAAANEGGGQPAAIVPLATVPEMSATPREAWFAERETVSLSAARGRISGEMIVPYPPGIPAICPGEKINSEVWSYLDELRNRGIHFHCSAGDSLSEVSVLK